jgi:hypothetical protein
VGVHTSCAWLAALAACAAPGDKGDRSADTAGDAPTSFSVTGSITDLGGQPIIDLFVTVSTAYCIPDRTDDSGAFEVREVRTGSKRLVTYGDTASNGLVASVSFSFDADEAIDFGSPIALPRLEETWPLSEQADEEQIVTTSDGLTLTIPAGALDIAPFAPAELQVARVPVQSAPDFVPDGIDLFDLFALHPLLSTLSPPASVMFPNDTDLPPGTRVQFHALDYEAGVLTPVASGTIDESGHPTTDAGQGIPELTWVGVSLAET